MNAADGFVRWSGIYDENDMSTGADIAGVGGFKHACETGQCARNHEARELVPECRISQGVGSALVRPHELSVHVKGAVNNGCSREEIREHLSGNYCRCTGYHAIVDAVETAAARLSAERPA